MGCLPCARFYFAQLSMRLLWKCGFSLLWEFMRTKRPAFQKEHWELRAQEKGLLKLMNQGNLIQRVPRSTIKQKVDCYCYFSYMGLPLQASEINRINCCSSDVLENNLKPYEILYSFSCKIMCLDIIVCHLGNSVILTNDNGLFYSYQIRQTLVL